MYISAGLGPVTDLSVTILNSSAVQVKWSPTTGSVIGYTITVYIYQERELLMIEVSDKTYLINGLSMAAIFKHKFMTYCNYSGFHTL